MLQTENSSVKIVLKTPKFQYKAFIISQNDLFFVLVYDLFLGK